MTPKTRDRILTVEYYVPHEGRSYRDSGRVFTLTLSPVYERQIGPTISLLSSLVETGEYDRIRVYVTP